MKERAILFSGPMVRAILEGRKTQTRRVMKHQPPSAAYQLATCISTTGDRKNKGKQHWIKLSESAYSVSDSTHPYFSCPFGKRGDRLWVRETFQEFFDDEIPAGRTRAVRGHMGIPGHPNRISYVAYRADGEIPESAEYGEALWRPSIFMPRWASRITLEVTAVRVERLQNISAEDAIAEGLKDLTKDGQRVKYGIPDSDGLPGNDDTGWHWADWRISLIDAYQHLWESINGPGSWAANPWVWVVEFKRVTP